MGKLGGENPYISFLSITKTQCDFTVNRDGWQIFAGDEERNDTNYLTRYSEPHRIPVIVMWVSLN